MPKKSISLIQLYDLLRDLEEQNKRNWDAVWGIVDNDSYWVGYDEALSHVRKHLQNLRVFERGSGEE